MEQTHKGESAWLRTYLLSKHRAKAQGGGRKLNPTTRPMSQPHKPVA